jgi:hypothetical protein
MQRVAVCFVACSALALLMAGGADAQESTDRFDCGDFQFQEEAQAVFNQDRSDPNGLDGPIGEASDGVAGVACEELPHRPGSGQRAGDPAAPGRQQYAREEVIRRTIPDRRLSNTGGSPLILPAGALLLSTGLLLGRSVIRRSS